MFLTYEFLVEVKELRSNKNLLLTIRSKSQQDIKKELSTRYEILSIINKPHEYELLLEKITLSPISKDDILRILKFLAQALDRGVVLKRALEFLIVSEQKKSVQRFLGRILERLQKQFSSYHDIFKDFPEYFDNSFLGIVKAGEASGTLAENILQYTEDVKKMDSQKEEIKNVFIKRGVLFTVVIAVAMVIITVVIPQFAKLFEKKANAPEILIQLTKFSQLIREDGLYFGLGFLIFVFLIVFLHSQSYRFKKLFDNFLIKLPIFGELFRTFYTCQYLYFTGTLLKKNVNYIKIMDILIEQTKSIPFKELFEIMKENVIRGIPLQTMLKTSANNLPTSYRKVPEGLLLPSLVQAIEMGSATGNMGEIMYDAFLSYEIILHQKIKSAITIFDRIFYAGIVLLMGVLFYAMGTAMQTMYQNAGSML